VSLLRLTVRTRLTLLYTGLFAGCGAIVVAVSYAQVAQLPARGQPGRSQPAAGNLGLFAARCRSQEHSSRPNPFVLAKCATYFQQQGAQGQRDLTLSHLLQYSLITLAVVLALAAILGWIVSGRALRPVHQITAAARAASDRNLSARVAPTGPRDELRELAETFDDMLARLEAAFEGQQRFIANASHELRTPLAVMHATADVVLSNPHSTADELRAMGEEIRAEVNHAERLIGALLLLARNERGLTVHEDVDLPTAVEDVLDGMPMHGQRLAAQLEPAAISGDPVLIERLIANLIDNAIRYNVSGGEIWVTTRSLADGSHLTVANTGPAISQADVSRIFQPFEQLSDRTSREGFGLGLAIVAAIAAIHGGVATAHPRTGGGLSVAIMFPAGR
jgi:signal transduction histidine kinase